MNPNGWKIKDDGDSPRKVQRAGEVTGNPCREQRRNGMEFRSYNLLEARHEQQAETLFLPEHLHLRSQENE
jgi:hypothetical protein